MMRNLNCLLPYNIFILCCEIYSLNIWKLDQLNPCSRLPLVILICIVSQFSSALIYKTLFSNYYKIMVNINISDLLRNLITSLLAFNLVIVLLGASITNEILNTFLLSTLLTILTTVPLYFYTKSNHTSNVLLILINPVKCEQKVESFITITSLVTLFGSWLSAFLIVVDWMQPWQQWPVCPCAGALIANAICHALCIIVILYTFIKRSTHLL